MNPYAGCRCAEPRSQTRLCRAPLRRRNARAHQVQENHCAFISVGVRSTRTYPTADAVEEYFRCGSATRTAASASCPSIDANIVGGGELIAGETEFNSQQIVRRSQRGSRSTDRWEDRTPTSCARRR